MLTAWSVWWSMNSSMFFLPLSKSWLAHKASSGVSSIIINVKIPGLGGWCQSSSWPGPGLSLVSTGHVTSILASHWSKSSCFSKNLPRSQFLRPAGFCAGPGPGTSKQISHLLNCFRPSLRVFDIFLHFYASSLSMWVRLLIDGSYHRWIHNFLKRSLY